MSEPHAAASPAGCTRDAILRGRLMLWQPESGYRFSVDALLLAWFAHRGRPVGPHRVADLGAGCGVVGLAVALTRPEAEVTLVELQPRLAGLCADNAAGNALSDRMEVVEADLRRLKGVVPGDAFESVVANPPFRPAGSGRESPHRERAVAHSELEVTLPEVVAAASRLLRARGLFCVVYPAERLPDLVAACEDNGLKPTRLLAVHPRPGEPARRILLEARKGSGAPLIIEAPLVVHRAPEAYTGEAARILEGDWE